MNKNKNKIKRRLKIALLSITLPALLIAASGENATAQTDATVYLEPGAILLDQLGKSADVTITIDHGGDLSGYDFAVFFDPQIIRVDSVELLAAERGMPLGPVIDNQRGRLSAGVLNYEGQSITTGVIDPVVKIIFTALAEGSTRLTFDKAILVDTSLESSESETSEGYVLVATQPVEAPLTLFRGGNKIKWSLNPSTVQEALARIDSQCGGNTATVGSRLKNGWWQTFVAGYGGVNFALDPGKTYYLRATKACTWSTGE